jgi:DNA-binding NarL/FixJ family response regulator
MKVLLVEDSEFQAGAIDGGVKAFCESVEVIHAGTIAEAKEKVAQCDLVVSDLLLPDSKPEQTLEWLSTINIPFMIVSGLVDATLIKAAAELGATAYLSKGDLPRQVIAMLRMLEAQSELARRRCEARRQTCLRAAERLNDQHLADTLERLNRDHESLCES